MLLLYKKKQFSCIPSACAQRNRCRWDAHFCVPRARFKLHREYNRESVSMQLGGIPESVTIEIHVFPPFVWITDRQFTIFYKIERCVPQSQLPRATTVHGPWHVCCIPLLGSSDRPSRDRLPRSSPVDPSSTVSCDLRSGGGSLPKQTAYGGRHRRTGLDPEITRRGSRPRPEIARDPPFGPGAACRRAVPVAGYLLLRYAVQVCSVSHSPLSARAFL
jgi:hypothetical protein